jgi:signal transduction histidine kinase
MTSFIIAGLYYKATAGRRSGNRSRNVADRARSTGKSSHRSIGAILRVPWRRQASVLGLSIARTIAREHGGDVTLKTRDTGGLRASIELPA